ncbi:MAG: hypothetical protein XXXNARYT_003165 [Candidatus Accumulibacter regalis]|uniref:hypothetical protein n=1 Tax=unclassified Candidatus Accumulibacter TaxID=2619054 RepID=UPI001AC564C0|nr:MULTISPECIES: hypothetical protein [unclassified Candidatus Accumulibacter]MBN8515830.1 hypothetical protein [Accumulibacter sp.]MBO3701881.1 hypothetical protein [Accumulibacter sp.]HRI92469.1 hypothetical protein [Accumulibacter sp.]
MKASTLLKLIGLIVVVALGYAAYRLGWSVIEPKIDQRVAKIGLTPNQIAANGPLPGDIGLYAKEMECQQKIPTPGYYSSLNGAEISDAQRSGLFPCASFLGARDGANTVYAWRSADDYPGISYINNRKPGELYIVGGEYPTLEDPNMAGPFVAKADATTGKQLWRTYLDNLNASGRWIGNANLNILANGKIAFSWSNQIVLLDADTGAILKHNTLPSGDAPAMDTNFKHMTIAPDGTLIMKDQTRPKGCTLQGTMAIIKCAAGEGMKQPNSQLVAVNPDTLEVLDDIQLPEPASSPHIVSMYEGRIAIYIGMDKSARRYFWDAETKKLSADDSWVIYPMQEGQTTATAPSLVGDWIAFQLNGAGSEKVASSIVVANLKDASRKQIIFPFGELKKGEWSFAPPKCGADPENNMIYSADMGVGKVAGIKLDPVSGELKVVFVLDDTTTTFQPLFGPPDERVLVLTNMKRNVEKEPLKAALFTANYKEQLTWRDAATGKIIAESDFFEPLTINSLTPPGFGGRVYFPTAVGKGFYVLQVAPKAGSPGGK